MLRLVVEVRFAVKIPDELRTELESEVGASHFEQHCSTLGFEVLDSSAMQHRIFNWTQQTCMVEGEVQAIKVTRIGP